MHISLFENGGCVMTSIRLATFNCENLFARYKFAKNFDPVEADGFTINNLAFDIFNEVEKKITAAAVAAVAADVMVLQEVENLLLLDRFHSQLLQGRLYPYRLLIDGNDPRNIDVAILSKHPILAARTWRHERDEENRPGLFSRDCLEVEIDVNGAPLVLFVNHLKSMMGGRGATRDRRVAQSKRVAEIFNARFGPSFDGNFAVLGDLNDYPETEEESGKMVETGIGALLYHPNLVNIVERLPKKERWTHWYKGGKKGKRAKQLDYILLGRSFDQRAGQPLPDMERRGLPWRAEEDYAGPRFPDVGHDEPKASDHCALYVDIPVAAFSTGAAGVVVAGAVAISGKPKKPKKPKKPA
jgi:endonuclease/exonuclease/phosphatase family metal-dependent hydrolase